MISCTRLISCRRRGARFTARLAPVSFPVKFTSSELRSTFARNFPTCGSSTLRYWNEKPHVEVYAGNQVWFGTSAEETKIRFPTCRAERMTLPSSRRALAAPVSICVNRRWRAKSVDPYHIKSETQRTRRCCSRRENIRRTEYCVDYIIIISLRRSREKHLKTCGVLLHRFDSTLPLQIFKNLETARSLKGYKFKNKKLKSSRLLFVCFNGKYVFAFSSFKYFHYFIL